MRRGALTMVCAAEPTGPSHLLPKTARCRTTAFGAEPARCQACSGQEEARQISTHRFIAATALWERAAHRRAIGMRRAFRSRRRTRGVVVLARSHRIGHCTHRRISTRCTYGIQFVRSLSRLARARLLSVSYGQHEFLECAPCTSTVVVRNTERYGKMYLLCGVVL